MYGNHSIYPAKVDDAMKIMIGDIEHCEQEEIDNIKCQKEEYDKALEKLNLQNLSERRQMLAGRFAVKCTRNDRFKELFPLNSITGVRHSEKYAVKFAHTDRLKDSSIPAMQRLLNRKNRK